VGWLNPSDLPQSRLWSSCSYHADGRAAEAVSGWWPCSAGTAKARTESAPDTSASGKIIWRESRSALPQASCISSGYSVLSCFSSADHCAAVLSCGCNPPGSEYYVLVTPQLLGWTGLRTTRRSMSCHKADLTVRSAQPCFQSLIYDFSLLPSFGTGTVQCFNFTGSQSPRFSSVEVWGLKRNASEVHSDAQKLI